MTTNVQSTRLSSRRGESAVLEPTPVITPTGVGGVAVYDVDATPNPALRPSVSPSMSRVNDRELEETESGSSILTWVIGAILLIVLAYFLLQIVI